MSVLLCFLVLVFHAELALSVCTVDYCEIDNCSGDSCTGCEANYFLAGSSKCDQCYLYCRHCPDTGLCYRCVHASCDKCISNCTCSWPGYNVNCVSCPNGFYFDNTRCYPCAQMGCKCTKNNSCTGCLPGMYGSNCDENCVDNCEKCLDKDICETCNNEYYSANGTVCTHCPETCKNNTSCDKYNGACIEGCKKGWTGMHCNIACLPRCSQCAQTNSSCITCKHGFYGDQCKSECSVNCHSDNDDNLQRSCDKQHGECLFGCATGWFGTHCKTLCSKQCMENKCYQHNGTCTHGCNDGYTGATCVTELQSSSHENSTTNAVNVALAVVTGIAVLVAVVSVIGNVILLKRGRFDFMHNTDNASSHVSREQEQDSNGYQDLNRTESAERAYSTVTHEYENAL